VRLAAERLRKLKCFAAITAATNALMQALDELGRPDAIEEQQVTEYINGELTAHGYRALGMSSPRRPLPKQEGV